MSNGVWKVTGEEAEPILPVPAANVSSPPATIESAAALAASTMLTGAARLTLPAALGAEMAPSCSVSDPGRPVDPVACSKIWPDEETALTAPVALT